MAPKKKSTNKNTSQGTTGADHDWRKHQYKKASNHVPKAKKAKRQKPAISEYQEQEIFEHLNVDLLEAIKKSSRRAVEYLIDLRYGWQDLRKRANQKGDSLYEQDLPAALMDWHYRVMNHMEKQFELAMAAWTEDIPICQWMEAHNRVKAVFSAGIYAQVQLQPPPTYYGSMRRYMGLDPTSVWLSKEEAKQLVRDKQHDYPAIAGALNLSAGRFWEWIKTTFDKQKDASNYRGLLRKQWKSMSKNERTKYESILAKAACRRPHNQAFKPLLYLLGATAFQFGDMEKSLYRHLIDKRRAEEEPINARRGYKDQAYRELREKSYDLSRDAAKYYRDGYLPPAHMQHRAQRYAVGVFLAHLHRHCYRQYYRVEPPSLWVHEHGRHNRYIEPEVHWNIPEIEGNSDIIYPWRDGIVTIPGDLGLASEFPGSPSHR